MKRGHHAIAVKAFEVNVPAPIAAQALAFCTPAVQLYESREAARRHVSAASESEEACIRIH